MLNTYENAVTTAIEYFAQQIKNCAHDSVAENNDYAITDSVDSINFLFSNYATFDSVQALASAALNSTLDTVVRENIHYALTEIN
jgi:hypothetical protein